MLAVLPFLNNNSFFNTAMGQGNGGDYSSYSRDNSYDNTYSKYPTKDKKIACKTGQFEGFFVSSVEFCKLKIAQGPEGAQGPQGEQGPPGITQSFNSSNVYLVTNSSNVGTSGQVTALCQPGDFVLTGGYSFSGNVIPELVISHNHPIISPIGAGWIATLQFGPGNNILSVYALCFDTTS